MKQKTNSFNNGIFGSRSYAFGRRKTAHSPFKLTLNLNYKEFLKCDSSKQSKKSDIIKDCKLIDRDESKMINKGGFEALICSLQDKK